MNETQIIEVANADWHGRNLSVPREMLLAGVERGKVLYFPNLRFAIEGGEQALLDPALADPNRKNISLEPNGGAHQVAMASPESRPASTSGAVSCSLRAAATTLTTAKGPGAA